MKNNATHTIVNITSTGKKEVKFNFTPYTPVAAPAGTVNTTVLEGDIKIADYVAKYGNF